MRYVLRRRDESRVTENKFMDLEQHCKKQWQWTLGSACRLKSLPLWHWFFLFLKATVSSSWEPSPGASLERILFMFNKGNPPVRWITLHRDHVFFSSSFLSGSLCSLSACLVRCRCRCEVYKTDEGWRWALQKPQTVFSPVFWSLSPLQLQSHIFNLTVIHILSPAGVPWLPEADGAWSHIKRL